MGLGFQFSGALSRLSACRWQFYGLLAHAGLSRRRSLVATQCPLAPAAAGRRTASSYHILGYLGQRDEPSRFLTRKRGENWTKEIDYLYLGIGSLGIVFSINRIDIVIGRFQGTDIIVP